MDEDRKDGKTDGRGRSPGSRAGMVNLRPGNSGVREAKAGLLDELKSKEGVLEALRRQVLSGGDTAAIQAAKALLEEYRETEGPSGLCWRCNQVLADQKIPASTLAWIDELEAASHQGQERCQACGGDGWTKVASVSAAGSGESSGGS